MSDTDHELLKWAAKAANMAMNVSEVDGMKLYTDDTTLYTRDKNGYWRVWNPLIYDSDAFQLLVMLDMEISRGYDDMNVVCYICEGMVEYIDDNRFTAMRKLIVRVAAWIGKGMPLQQ